MKNIKYTDSAQFKCLEDLKETSLELYLVHSGKEHCAPSHTFSGCRDEYIIHFVLSGKGYYTAHGKNWSLTVGQMFLICPDETITYQADANEPWSYAWIGFNGMKADSILKNCGFSKLSLVLPYDHSDYVLQIVEQILEARHLTYANDIRRKAYLMMLLADIVDAHTSLLPGNAQKYDYTRTTYLEHAIDFISLRYSDGINVSDIANYVGISRTYLNHIFQKELGISAQKFLIDFRLHKAASLLLGTEQNINEVSKSVGYEDALAFSKAFKKKFDVSPKNYRTHQDTMNKFSFKQP